MYKLELDVHLIFEPPMDSSGDGILVTRSTELPFVPVNGMALYSQKWENYPEPFGLKLRDVIWDLDRAVFLATAKYIHGDFPIAMIPSEVFGWTDRGWRLGSYKDQYITEEEQHGPVRVDSYSMDWMDRLKIPPERLHAMAQEKRPKEFNAIFKAVIRHMARTFNNVGIAYAMDRTGRYLGASRNYTAQKDWLDVADEFNRLTPSRRREWCDHVSEYPDLKSILT